MTYSKKPIPMSTRRASEFRNFCLSHAWQMRAAGGFCVEFTAGSIKSGLFDLLWKSATAVHAFPPPSRFTEEAIPEDLPGWNSSKGRKMLGEMGSDPKVARRILDYRVKLLFLHDDLPMDRILPLCHDPVVVRNAKSGYPSSAILSLADGKVAASPCSASVYMSGNRLAIRSALPNLEKWFGKATKVCRLSKHALGYHEMYRKNEEKNAKAPPVKLKRTKPNQGRCAGCMNLLDLENPGSWNGKRCGICGQRIVWL